MYRKSVCYPKKAVALRADESSIEMLQCLKKMVRRT